VIFRQFRAADSQLSYLFADPVTRRAAVLDPHLSLEREYLEMIGHLDLKLAFAIETHAHESHLSAAPLLCEETGACWLMSRLVAARARARPVDDGECVYIGEECVAALATPGHSACSMCFRWRDRVFTGHTLLTGRTGDCARTDADAATLYHSVARCLYALPGDTLVFPGLETASGRASTIQFERRQNADLNAATSPESFVHGKRRAGGSLKTVVLPTGFGRPGADLYRAGKDGGR
jgi:glyoxylase-like metal-dependent hydrolase (beta-lactamase superfamily II)